MLRAAEDRAGQRYALDTVEMWPRLLPHVTSSLGQALRETRTQLDATVRLSAALVLATVVSAAMLLTDGPWLLIPVGTAVLSWVAYQAAVNTALKYGQALHVAFDVHRFDMLRGLHYPLPPTLEQERAFNEELVRFFRHGEPISGDDAEHRYQHEPETPALTQDQASRQGGLLQAFVAPRASPKTAMTLTVNCELGLEGTSPCSRPAIPRTNGRRIVTDVPVSTRISTVPNRAVT